jgi:hypothetical protein
MDRYEIFQRLINKVASILTCGRNMINDFDTLSVTIYFNTQTSAPHLKVLIVVILAGFNCS